MTKIMNAETDPHLVQPDMSAINSEVESKYVTVDSYEIIQGNKIPDQIVVSDTQTDTVETQSLDDINNQIASEQADQETGTDEVGDTATTDDNADEQPAA